MSSDNYRILMQNEGCVISTLDLFFQGKSMCGFIADDLGIDNANRMVLFQHPHEDSNRFPCMINSEEVGCIINKWLAGVQYPDVPDIDGTCKKGWLIKNDEWGFVKPFGFEAFCSIEPVWILYGR